VDRRLVRGDAAAAPVRAIGGGPDPALFQLAVAGLLAGLG